MKRTLCMITALMLIFNISAYADRNEDRRREQEQEAQLSENNTVKDLPEKIASLLDGYIFIRTENKAVFADGKAKKIDTPAYAENGRIFIPAAITAEFFGKTALWIKENGSVKIGETVIYPSETSKIVNGRTMIDAETIASVLGAEVVYKNDDTVILGTKAIAQNTLDTVIAALRNKFYVTNDTTANGDGTIEKPYGGINAAIKALRAYTASGMNTNIDVYLRGGVYANREAITFTPEDSGKNGYTITYRSYPGEKAEVISAEPVKNWTKYADGIYKAKLDAKDTVNVLFENDTFAHKARYPNLGDGAYRDYYLESDGYDPNNTMKFYFKNNDLPYIEDRQQLQAAYFAGGENGFYNWWMEILNANIDYRERSLTLSMQPVTLMGKGSRYFIQGSLDLLDQSGEFYYEENSKTIYYKPYNDDINSQTITYATTSNPILLNGTAENHIRNIIFSDLKIGKSNMKTEKRAANDEAIMFTYADNCAVRDSEILLTGSDAVVLRNCNKCDVSGNYMHDLGAEAVKTSCDFAYGEVKYSGNTINNNYIKDVGLIARASSAIHLDSSDYGTVMYNHIDGAPRMGILFGTGYMGNMLIGKTIRNTVVDVKNQFDFVSCAGNKIEYNDVSNVMLDTQDGGAIYTWGAGKGNVVANNHIHDVDFWNIGTYPMGYAVYNDDASAYTTYSRNIIDSNQLKGKGEMYTALIVKSVGNTITNNFILNNKTVQSAFGTYASIDDPGNLDVYRNNLTMNSGDRVNGQYDWTDDRYRLCDYNLYYNDNGKYGIYKHSKAKTLDEWKKINTAYGYMDNNSVAGEDPQFIDYSGRDYRLRYDSPAYGIGITDIDEKNIGVKEDFKFADKEGEIGKLYLDSSSDGESANIRIKSGETSQIIPTARTKAGFAADLDNAKLTYGSSDASVAAVDESGNITGLKTGIAEITVTLEKGGTAVRSSMFVLVNDNFADLSVNLSSKIIDNGGTTEIVGIGHTDMGYSVPLANASYKSSDEKIAAVDENGRITALSPGSATITVSGTYKGVTKNSSAEIRVLNGVLDKINIKAEKSDAILVGEKIQLDYDATLTTGEVVDHNDVKVTYSSDDENVAKVDENGLLTAVGEGRTNITVSLEKDGLGKSESMPVAIFEKYSGTLADGYKEINFGKSHGYADFRDDGTILMRSTGDDYYGKADDGYYLYKDITNSDVTIEMNVKSLLETSVNAAVGLTIRESATAGSKNYTIRTLDGGHVISVWRDETDGTCNYADHGRGKYPQKLKIEKKGSNIKSYVDFGKGWEEAYTKQLDVGSTYTVGIPMFSQSTLSTEAVVSGLSIK